MWWVVELKKTPLARDELRSLAGAFGADVRFAGSVGLVSKPLPFWRLTQARWAACEFPAGQRLDDFRVTGPHHLELWLGKKLEGNVNLSRPKTVVRVARAGNRVMYGIEAWHYSHKEISSPVARSPGMLKPETARLLVNLAGVKPGERVLDPFCGTGTIVVEAAIAGANATGVDDDWHMIEMSERNSSAAGIDAALERADFFNFKTRKKFDVVITDLPYGRSAKRKGAHLENRALEKIALLLSNGGRVLVVSHKKLHAPKTLYCEHVFRQRVHRSLTRHIHVLKQKR